MNDQNPRDKIILRLTDLLQEFKKFRQKMTRHLAVMIACGFVNAYLYYQAMQKPGMFLIVWTAGCLAVVLFFAVKQMRAIWVETRFIRSLEKLLKELDHSPAGAPLEGDLHKVAETYTTALKKGIEKDKTIDKAM